MDFKFFFIVTAHMGNCLLIWADKLHDVATCGLFGLVFSETFCSSLTEGQNLADAAVMTQQKKKKKGTGDESFFLVDFDSMICWETRKRP